MNDSSKKAILIFGGGALLFMLIKYVFKVQDDKERIAKEKEKAKDKEKTEPDNDEDAKASKKEKQKDAMVLKKAFVDAIKDKQPAKFLNEMNAEFAKTYQMKVHKSKSTNKLFVADLQGNVILE
jgi:hypothetical protein